MQSWVEFSVLAHKKACHFVAGFLDQCVFRNRKKLLGDV